MNIAGLQKTTLVDFPGKVAATVFTRGCSFRCPFCHNPELVLPEKFIPLMDEEEILKFFEKRKDQLEAVCITGGEPTIHNDIHSFIHKLKEMGYLVKLDTNGSRPEKLKELIDSGKIDYVAMDIKSPLHKYEAATNIKYQISNIKIKEVIPKSINLIMNSNIDYEFRTTVVHPIHEVKDFEEIGRLIKGAKRYYIQNFVQSKHIDEHQKFSSFSDDELEQAKKIMEKYVKKVEIR